MTNKSAASDIDNSASLNADEQRLLDTALLESDQLLARSLHDDQRRRRWRIAWLSALLVGGVAMTTLIVGVLGGWISLAGQVSASGSDADIERAETLAAEGWQLWQQRDFTGAVEKFRQSTKLDPESADAWNGLGWSLFNSGQSVEGEKAFQKCVRLNPQHPAGLNGLGQIYLMWNELDKAEKYLKKAAPQAPAAWYGLARLYLLQENFQQAKPWVEKILAQNPNDQAMQQMQRAVERGKLSDALRRQITPPGKPAGQNSTNEPAKGKQEESFSQTDVERGWAMFQQGKARTAERLFRRAIEKAPDNVSALNGLGFVLLNQGKHAEAKPLFEKCLKLEQDSPGPMNGLARCLQAEGKTDEAIAVWEAMAKKYPGPTAAAVGLAYAYLEKGEYEKAAKYFQVLVESDPHNAEFQSGLKKAQAGLAKQE